MLNVSVDAKFEQISSIPSRKRAVTADLAVSGIEFCSIHESNRNLGAFSGIFLIAFFSLWSKYAAFDLKEEYSGRLAKLAILICLLSAVAWVSY